MNVLKTKLTIIASFSLLFVVFWVVSGAVMAAANAVGDTATSTAESVVGEFMDINDIEWEGPGPYLTSTSFPGVGIVVSTDGESLLLRFSNDQAVPLMGCGFYRQCTLSDIEKPVGLGWNVAYQGTLWEREGHDCYVNMQDGEEWIAEKTACKYLLSDTEAVIK